MQVKALRCLILASVIAVMFSGVARADLLSGCPSCFGSTYLLTYAPEPGAPGVWDITLTIDTSGYTGAAGDWIQVVSVKASSDDQVIGVGQAGLDVAPVGTWNVFAGGQNSNGCTGSGNGFICAQDGTSAVVGPGKVYVWTFDYVTNNLFTGLNQASIKADYYGLVNGQPNFQGQLSNNITLQVPDGGATLMLLGGALVGLATLRRRFSA
jgi:hypothetical protein